MRLLILFVVQKFLDQIVIGFWNNSIEKIGSKVKFIPKVKNEIKIITLLDDVFSLKEDFLERHALGDMISSETRLSYNSAQSFHKKSCSLKEFFKHLGHFSHEDLQVYVRHLLGTTPN